MTREQRNTLYRQIEYLTRVKDTFDQDLCEILNGIVANLPVADPAPVGETAPAPTELEAAVGELLARADNVVSRYDDACQTKYDENKWADFAEDPCPIQSLAIAIRRVRAAMGRRA